MTVCPPIALTISVLLSGLASGQTDIGPGIRTVHISGRVTDQSGARISNPNVKFKVATLDVTPVVVHADQDGTFAFRAEPLRRYELIAEMVGFSTTTKTIDVETGKEFNAGDIVMPVGDASSIDRLDYIDATESSSRLTIHGIGGTGTSTTLSVSDLSKLPQKTGKAKDHGTSATFEGALLTDVLRKVDLPLGEKFDSTCASYYLIAEAQGGYDAVFAWAELDSTFMNKSVYVVTKRNGKPLSNKDGPFQLLVPGEKRPARGLRQLTALSIRQAN